MFPHAGMCPILPLISYLIHATTSVFLNNDDTKNLNLIVLLGRSAHQRMTTLHCFFDSVSIRIHKAQMEIQMLKVIFCASYLDCKISF